MPYPFYFIPEIPADADLGAGDGNVILKGFGGPMLLTGGYGGTAQFVGDTLAEAIIARFASDPDLATLVPSGLYYRRVPNSVRSELPYGVLMGVTEAVSEDTRGPSYETTYFQADFYTANGDELTMDKIKRAWYAVFGPTKPKLLWRGRSQVRFSNMDARELSDNSDAPGGAFGQTIEVNRLIIEFLVISQPST